MIKIFVLQQASDRCPDIISVLKFIIRSNAGFTDVLSASIGHSDTERDLLNCRLKTFSAGGGFLLGAVAGYAIKKVMKIASVVIGLFVAALAYLSYRGCVDVKWAAMEDASRSTLANASEQIVHALNSTTTQFAAHPSAVATSGVPVAAIFGFVPGLMVGFKKA
jgi:uncharacterized membrane protein (Fun14 family)